MFSNLQLCNTDKPCRQTEQTPLFETEKKVDPVTERNKLCLSQRSANVLLSGWQQGRPAEKSQCLQKRRFSGPGWRVSEQLAAVTERPGGLLSSPMTDKFKMASGTNRTVAVCAYRVDSDHGFNKVLPRTSQVNNSLASAVFQEQAPFWQDAVHTVSIWYYRFSRWKTQARSRTFRSELWPTCSEQSAARHGKSSSNQNNIPPVKLVH